MNYSMIGFYEVTYRSILIAVDKQATGTVQGGVCLAPDFCAEIAMPAERNSKRAKGQP
jgi:hypothetical protein